MDRKEKVTLVCTVKNEGASILEFLASIANQSRVPDEWIIVDGGSTDDTAEKMRSFAAKRDIPLEILVRPGANEAQALNIAVRCAKYDVIACTTAGCTYSKDWLENLVGPFENEPSVEVVAGWYEPDARTPFEQVVAEVTMPKLDEVNPDEFLPSFRSMAFRRSAWSKVGGVPEWLTFAADDTLFDMQLKRAGVQFHFAPDAVVYWRPRGNYRGLWKQFFGYARGDGEAKIRTRVYASFILKKYITGILLGGLGFWHWLFWIALAVGFLLFVFRIVVRYPRYPLTVLMMILIIDNAKIIGWLKGRWNRLRGFKGP